MNSSCKFVHLNFYILYIVLLFLPAPSLGWHHSWPKFELPKGMHSEWIAQDMQHNGLDMKVLRIFNNTPAQETLEFFVKNWASGDARPRAITTPSTLVLSRVFRQSRGTFQLTLELQAHETQTQGVLSLMRLDYARQHPSFELNPQLPPGAKVVSDTLSTDANILNRTLVATHQNSVMHNAFRFKQKLKARGWSLTPTTQGDKHTSEISVKEKRFAFIKNKDELYIHLIPGEVTSIVAVYLRKP